MSCVNPRHLTTRGSRPIARTAEAKAGYWFLICLKARSAFRTRVTKGCNCGFSLSAVLLVAHVVRVKLELFRNGLPLITRGSAKDESRNIVAVAKTNDLGG